MTLLSRRSLLGRGALAAASVALLAACGGATPAPTTAPAKPPAEGAQSAGAKPPADKAPEAAKPAAGSGGKPVIQLWDGNTDWKKMPGYWTEQTAQKFPAAEVNVSVITGDGAAKLLAAFTAGSGAPDIFLGKVADYNAGTGAIDVGDVLPAELQSKFESQVLKGISQFYKAKGQWYGLPVSADLGMMLLYNTDYFKDAGLDVAKPPTTMAELREYAVKLTKKDEKGEVARWGHTVRATTSPVGIADKFLPYLHAFGGRVYAEDGTKASGFVNGADSVRALEFVSGMVLDDKVANPQLGMPEDQFAAGQAAMCFRESWFVGAMKERGPSIKFDTALLPKEKAYPGISLFFSGALQVYKKSPLKDVAFKWLDFISGKEHDLAIAKLENFLPVLTENYSDPYIQERRDAKVINQILSAPPGPYYDHPRVSQLANRLGQGIEEVMAAKKKPKEALDEAAADMDKLMARK